MRNFLLLTGIVCLTVFCLFSESTLLAQSPFVDQVPSSDPEGGGDEVVTLELTIPVRVVMRSKLGVVLRGEMRSISKEGATIVTDRAKLRNPEGVEYKFDAIQSLNIPEHELYWSKGEETAKFLKDVSESETIEFKNLQEFLAANSEEAASPDVTTDPTETDTASAMPSNNTVIRMQPANKKPVARPTITIICGNCEKEVSLNSDSGQECPHCNIMWDTSPLDAAELAQLQAEEEAAQREYLSNLGNNNSTNLAEETNTEPTVDEVPQPARTAQNAAVGPQPVAVPAPIQAAPQEITLENLPLWMKVSVFFVCFGVMYYAIFVR